ncbi:hypothetical protein AB4Y77_01480 [Paenarthrobacter sp. YAF11_1]|uniref:hypothetical protein n=1 Tax=Paenarthrobacter sp. YAF11_1 TaxID=3233074 RepID=UPI003F964DB8
MSNYFFVFAATSAQSKVKRWVRKHQTGKMYETYPVHVSPDIEMTAISHALNDSLDLPTNTFFKGHMVDHRAGSAVFGLKGWLDYSQQHDTSDYVREGQFVHLNWTNDEATFRRDAFGMLPLMHTQGSGYVAVSDSMLALTDFRRNMGDAVTPNEEVLLSRALLAVYGGQQLSPDTYVEQISFVPARQTLTVSLGQTPTARTSGEALDGLRLEPGETYRDGLRTGAENIARTMATLTQLGDGWKPALSLSGGYDSRVPLAGAIAAGTAQDLQINTKNTQPIHADDFDKATQIVDRFGLTLNGKSDAGRLSDRTYSATPFTMWALADLGMYDYITRTKAARNQVKHINLTGMGGEVMRGNYGWRSWGAICDSFTDPHPAVVTALYHQGVKGLEAVGAAPNTRQSSELHYMNYRYALHGGTGRPLQMLGFAPLLQSKLVALAHSDVNEHPFPTSYQKSIVNDLCIALSPELSAMPYDVGKAGRVSKDLTPAYIEERLASIGGPIDTSILKPYEVFGAPDDVPAGPPEFMLSIAAAHDLDRELTNETVLYLGRLGLDVLTSDPLRAIYQKLYDNGKWRLETKKYPLTGAAKDSPTKNVVLYALFAS